MYTSTHTHPALCWRAMGDPGDPFDAAFRELEAHWTEDAAHRRFIAFCATQGALAEAGRRYRKVREEDPERRDEAARRIDAVLAQAMQHMELLRSEARPPSHNLRWVVGACVCLAIFALLSILRARSH
jgi:hypothetical protein